MLSDNAQVEQPGTPILEPGDPGNLEIVGEFLSCDVDRVRKRAEATIPGIGRPVITAPADRAKPFPVMRISDV